jgi:hypothetical protein
VFNTTFSNIPVISWRSVLLVEETEVPGKKTTDLPQVTDNNNKCIEIGMMYEATDTGNVLIVW